MTDELRVVHNPEAIGYIQVWCGNRCVMGAPWAEPLESWERKGLGTSEISRAYNLIARYRRYGHV